MNAARNDEIEDPREITDRFIEMTRQVHEVTLCFQGVLLHHPITVVSVDRATGSCVLCIPKQKDIARLLKDNTSFNLHAREQSCSLHSSLMQCAEILDKRKKITLRCALPDLMEVVWDRNDFRVTLKKEMAVAVTLSGPDGMQWNTSLRDLSMGGCLLSMPARLAKGLKTGDLRYRLCAGFPNGERFEIGGRLKNYRVGDSRKYMYLGIAFDIDSYREKRDLRFYVGEIEREAARLSHERSELRALAPSRLFPTPVTAKKSAGDRSVAG